MSKYINSDRHVVDMQKLLYDKFAFTLVDNRSDQGDYLLVFSDWEKRGVIINYKYSEFNKQGYVHFHGLITVPKKFYRKSLIPKGYSCRFKRLFNEDGWLNYCRKDQDDNNNSLDTDDNELMIRLKRPIFINL